MYNQISSNSFKNKITFKQFIYKLYMYNHLTVYEQMTDVKLNKCKKEILETT